MCCAFGFPIFLARLVNIFTCSMTFVWLCVAEVFHMARGLRANSGVFVFHCVHS